jgi:hypothetical protein
MDAFRQNFRDVLRPERFFDPGTFHTILEHGEAEGTVGYQDRGSGLYRHVHPFDIHTFADLFFGEDSTAAGTAAEGLGAVFVHFSQAAAGD